MANVVTLRTMEGKNITEEKMKLIQAAAKLIKEDIKAIKTSHEVYPACDDLESLEASIDFLPDTLKALLEGLLFFWKENCSQLDNL